MNDNINDNIIIVNCPHCNDIVLIEKLNCSIFRHGVYKNNGAQIDAHSPKHICEDLILNNKIYGCGKPFKIIQQNTTYIAVICEYI